MFKFVDTDRHVTEPMEMWQHYVDKEIFARAPVTLDEKQVEKDGQQVTIYQAMIDGYPVFANWSLETQIVAYTQKKNGEQQRYDSMGPHGQLKVMTQTGIESAYLFPGFAMNIVNHAKVAAEVSVAYADAYNRWLNDYVSKSLGRLKGVGVVSRHQPDEMVAQVEKIIANGWTSVVIRPEVIEGRSLADSAYHEFYRFCANNNIAIIIHGGTYLYGSTVGVERFSSRFALHACSYPMEVQMAFLTLLESGVLEQNPTLKIGFPEAGCSWVPHWLWRLDNICYPEFPELVQAKIKKLPSEYFKQHCWVAIEPGEPCVDEVVKVIGHKKLICGTDFPHVDHLDFDPERLMSCGANLTQEQLKDIFENNPLDLFERQQ